MPGGGVGTGRSGSVPMIRHQRRPRSSIASPSVSGVVWAMCHSADSALNRDSPKIPTTTSRSLPVSAEVRIPASVRASSSAAAYPAFHGVIAAPGVDTAAKPPDAPPPVAVAEAADTPVAPAEPVPGRVAGVTKLGRTMVLAAARNHGRSAGRRRTCTASIRDSSNASAASIAVTDAPLGPPVGGVQQVWVACAASCTSTPQSAG
ncbi:hypothetical protein [Actinomadura nitritigenes]|uniref:hypothetical protein n=1 Tax=Actinomadura nitritigenes TaxID=134602 RepID=UPI003D8CD68C